MKRKGQAQAMAQGTAEGAAAEWAGPQGSGLLPGSRMFFVSRHVNLKPTREWGFGPHSSVQARVLGGDIHARVSFAGFCLVPIVRAQA